MLTRVELEDFRGFRRLALDGLQRVNLIVGKNNSDKTSLMEGVATLVNPQEAPEQIKRLRQLENHLASDFAHDRFSD